MLGVCVVLVMLSRFLSSAISLIAFTPLLWLLESSMNRKTSLVYWFSGSILIITLSSIFALDSVVTALIYGVGLTATLSLYLLTSKFSKNRLGIFTILFFWIAFDYLILKVLPNASAAFLSGFFDGSKAMGWSRTTGNLGITAWIIISNLLFYYVLLWKDAIFSKNIRWLSLIYTLILIALPLLAGLYFVPDLAPITLAEMTSVYTHYSSSDISYTENGEWLGRISARVSIMVVVFALIKSKTKSSDS